MASTNVRWATAKRILDRIRVRRVTDGITTLNDATVTSVTAAFTTTDIGLPISGPGIPALATIASFNSATSIEMSANATANGTGITIVIGNADRVDVGVTPGYAGESITPDAVWLDSIIGDIEIANLKAGRKERDDNFDVPVLSRVAANGRDHDEVMERITEIAASIEDELANDPGLDELDGVISAEVTSEQCSCAQFTEGWIGFGEVIVSVHARLT
jgi:hypothetical protein